eukprot:352616-Chlamydomonas_euryale.AAC.11
MCDRRSHQGRQGGSALRSTLGNPSLCAAELKESAYHELFRVYPSARQTRTPCKHGASCTVTSQLRWQPAAIRRCHSGQQPRFCLPCVKKQSALWQARVATSSLAPTHLLPTPCSTEPTPALPFRCDEKGRSWKATTVSALRRGRGPDAAAVMPLACRTLAFPALLLRAANLGATHVGLHASSWQLQYHRRSLTGDPEPRSAANTPLTVPLRRQRGTAARSRAPLGRQAALRPVIPLPHQEGGYSRVSRAPAAPAVPPPFLSPPPVPFPPLHTKPLGRVARQRALAPGFEIAGAATSERAGRGQGGGAVLRGGWKMSRAQERPGCALGWAEMEAGLEGQPGTMLFPTLGWAEMEAGLEGQPGTMLLHNALPSWHAPAHEELMYATLRPRAALGLF